MLAELTQFSHGTYRGILSSSNEYLLLTNVDQAFHVNLFNYNMFMPTCPCKKYKQIQSLMM